MIRVDRNRIAPPKALRSPEALDAIDHIKDYYSLPNEELQRFRTHSSIRATQLPGVKESLIKLFNGKCAYCEISLEATSGDIDLFRPRSAAQDHTKKTSVHHYGWLELEWDNLYLSCPACSRAKGNKFPVEGKRADLGWDYLKTVQFESPMLVDPCVDYPFLHLRFGSDGHCFPRSHRGEESIEIFGLNRNELVDARLLRLSLFDEHFDSNPALASEYLSQGAPFFAAVAEHFSRRDPYTDLEKLLLGEYLPTELVNRYLRRRIRGKRSTPIKIEPHHPIHLPTTAHMDSMPLAASPFLTAAEMKNAEKPIRKLEIRNFKGIRSLDISFPESAGRPFEDDMPCLMLLGENATGKSTILEAIALVLLGTNGARDLAPDPQVFFHTPHPHSEREVSGEPFSIKLWFYYEEEPISIKARRQGDRFVWDGQDLPSKVVIGYGPRRFFEFKKNRWFRAPYRRVETLFNPMATIKNPDEWLSGLSGNDSDTVARALRILFMLGPLKVIDFNSTPSSVEVHERMTPINELSEGYRSIFAMIIDISRCLLMHFDSLENAYGVVLVDEIETHLHPRWKMRVVHALREAMPLVQFVTTTHDPLCLRGMTDNEVYVLQRDAERQIDYLQELPPLSGMRAEQLLTSEFFGLTSTADPTFDNDIFLYARLKSIPEEKRTEEDIVAIRDLGLSITDRIVSGDTLLEQISKKALRDFLVKMRSGKPAEMTQARKEIYKSALNNFNKIIKG